MNLGSHFLIFRTDIADELRDSAAPDMGAYQFIATNNDLSVLKLLSDSITSCGNDSLTYRVVIENSGYMPQTNFDIRFEVKFFNSLHYQKTFKYSDTLNRLKKDTIFFGPFNTSMGGKFSVKVFTKLSNDYDRLNDTMFSSFTTIATIQPFENRVHSICSGATLKLFQPNAFGYLNAWYSSPTAVAPIKVTDTLIVSPDKDVRYYVSKRTGFNGRGQITTFLNLHAGCAGGIMFDIKPSVRLNIDSLSSFFGQTGTQKVRIFIKKGSHYGFEKKYSAWTLIDSAVCNPKSTSALSSIVPTQSIGFEKDSTYGIYLNYLSKYTLLSNYTFSNSEIKIDAGTMLCDFFANVRPGYAFSGTIYYSHSYCESKRAPYDIKVKSPKIALRSDTSYCALNGIKLTLNAGSGFKSYLWNTGSKMQSIQINGAGIYTVTVSDNDGCIGTDHLLITENSNPIINLGNDTLFCSNEGINRILNPGAKFRNYICSTADKSQTITVKSAGVYSVNVVDNNGCAGVYDFIS